MLIEVEKQNGIKSLSLEPMRAYVTTNTDKRFIVPINDDNGSLIVPVIEGNSKNGTMNMCKYYEEQIKLLSDKNNTNYDDINLYKSVHIANICLAAWWLAYDYQYGTEDELYLYCDYDNAELIEYIDNDDNDHWTLASLEDGKYTKLFNNDKHDDAISQDEVISFIKIDTLLARCLIRLMMENGIWSPFPDE